MKEINLKELKNIQLQILDVVSEFCKINNIDYWLDSGTLLGAIRHKGYIPWDDDIDIGMMREDYEKFINIFNFECDRFKVKCFENDKKFYYPYAKIVDKNTVLFEPDLNGKQINVNIDLFVYDNIPNNEKTAIKMYKKRDFYRLCEDVHFSHGRPTGNFIRRCCSRLFRLFIKLFPRNHFIKKMNNNAKKYSQQATNYIGNFTGYMAKFIASKDIFHQMIDVEFEGKMYKAPVGFDEWLRLTYGDYMTLPPEDKRVSHHKFRAFTLT